MRILARKWYITFFMFGRAILFAAHRNWRLDVVRLDARPATRIYAGPIEIEIQKW